MDIITNFVKRVKVEEHVRENKRELKHEKNLKTKKRSEELTRNKKKDVISKMTMYV